MAQKLITELQLRDSFADVVNIPVDDTIQSYRVTGAQIRDFLSPLAKDSSGYIKNAGLSIVASSGAVTIGLRQKDGSAALTTGINATEIAFRSQTITSTGVNIIGFDTTTQLVIPSGATLGYANGDNAEVFIYAFYDGTNKGLAVCSRRLNERSLYSTVELDVDSDNQDLYASGVFTNCAIRLIGRFVCNTIGAAGTWVAPNNAAASGMQFDPMPVGVVLPYAASRAPSGYLLCHGQAISRARYSDLFSIIGVTHGQGDGSTTFNLPDYRGRFLRGVANGQTTDPNRTARTAMATGGNTGDNVGSVQAAATARPTTNFTTNSTGAHTHNTVVNGVLANPGSNSTFYRAGTGTNLTTNSVGNHSHSITGGGDSETRPVNAYVEYIIKV